MNNFHKLTLHFLKVKKKVDGAFPEQVDKERVEALFAQLVNKFNAESEGLVDHCVRLSLEGDVDAALKTLFRLEWEEEAPVFQILETLGQVIGFYSDFFANKVSAVVFSKKLFLRTCATMFEHFTWVIQNCFHKRNAFKKWAPRLLRPEAPQMKRRSDTKAFLTDRAQFSRLITRDAEAFEGFLEGAAFYIPKSNQVG